jgi:glycosyltransferase 2 family protein
LPRAVARLATENEVNGLLRRVLLVTFVGVLLYGLFAVYTGMHEIGASLAQFRWSAFALALALACFNYLLRFGKWQYYLARLGIRGIPVIDSLLVFLSGFVLTITPGKVGEVFKSAVLAKTHGIALERTATIVIADRLTDVIGIVLLILAGSATFPAGLPWALSGAAAVAVGLLVILWQPPALWLCDRLEQRRGKLSTIVPKLRHALAALVVLARPSSLVLPTLLSVGAWGAEGTALYVLLRGFQQQVSLPLAAVVYASATLAGALIPVPGGLGVVEGILRQGLIGWGKVALGAATASMILVRLCTLWWAVVVGFIALFLLRLRFPEALADAPRADAAASRIG